MPNSRCETLNSPDRRTQNAILTGQRRKMSVNPQHLRSVMTKTIHPAQSPCQSLYPKKKSKQADAVAVLLSPCRMALVFVSPIHQPDIFSCRHGMGFGSVHSSLGGRIGYKQAHSCLPTHRDRSTYRTTWCAQEKKPHCYQSVPKPP